MLLSFLFFFSSVLLFCLKRKHLLMMLLSLELIILSLYFNLYLYLMDYNYEYYLLMLFMVMSVCEGVLGLSLLVSMIRTHGGDYFQSLNILW
uniref:NADH-ubiquinone oxidoreductase chain 4L n=1 Tax=Anobiinae sp. BMNH 1274383 TaxID=1796498 RepID=A0A140EFU4_9COLE|nr:NADH dehydrogenase subunit 4L [Anobiinae sp. BMNH 1274383]